MYEGRSKETNIQVSTRRGWKEGSLFLPTSSLSKQLVVASSTYHHTTRFVHIKSLVYHCIGKGKPDNHYPNGNWLFP